jgi:CheY-like chemotaxis protein
VVEDDPVVRAVAVTTLRGLGYRVLEAADGEQGLAQARRHAAAIQLIVTDVVMPRMGGVSMVDQIRRGNGTLPAIFTSGYAADAGPLATLPGRSIFLHKPYSPTELAESIRRLLDLTVSVSGSP